MTAKGLGGQRRARDDIEGVKKSGCSAATGCAFDFFTLDRRKGFFSILAGARAREAR